MDFEQNFLAYFWNLKCMLAAELYFMIFWLCICIALPAPVKHKHKAQVGIVNTSIRPDHTFSAWDIEVRLTEYSRSIDYLVDKGLSSIA